MDCRWWWRRGCWGAAERILLLSVIFALAHLRNPDVTAAAIGNIALAGIFLSLAFFSPGGMWTAFGAHLGWNATLAALAAPVSGLPFDIPAIDYRTGVPAGSPGARSGPRAGCCATVTLAATVVAGGPMEPKGIHMSRAAVIGAGTMGNGIAHVFAQHGWSVALIDTVPAALDKATATIRSNLDRQVKKGAIPADAPAAILGRIAPATALDAAAGASAGGRGRQREPGREVRRSSSSSTGVASAGRDPGHQHELDLDHRDRRADAAARAGDRHALHESGAGDAAGRGHPRARDERRDDPIASWTTAAALGKTPVEVNDYPGFVSNRVLMPMINEAIFCVMEGVATPEAIDTVMKLGMAHPMGPLQLADFIGLDVCLAILEVLHEGPGRRQVPAVPAAPQDGGCRDTSAGRRGRGFYDYRETK